ncbi:MAG: chemotaxis protein CheW [Planctomycetes bacterium]|nr:chemotaxis protein CheW [Planctomycetota bacterium]
MSKEQESLKVLRVRAGGREFALDVGLVRAIDRPAHRVRLPGAPPYVRGVVEVRGQAVAVVDLAARLGLPPQATAEPAVVVVDSLEPVGLWVEALGDVDAVAPGSLVDLGPPGLAAGLRAVAVDGTVVLEVEPLVDGRALEPAAPVLAPLDLDGPEDGP